MCLPSDHPVLQSMPEKKKIVQEFEISDVLWELLEPVLPPQPAKSPKGGRPPVPVRKVADAIYFVLKTGCQWKAISVKRHGVGASTAHRYFQNWVEAGVFHQFWALGLIAYDVLQGIQWEWQAADGAMTKAPLGGRQADPTLPIGRRRGRNARYSPMAEASPSVL